MGVYDRVVRELRSPGGDHLRIERRGLDSILNWISENVKAHNTFTAGQEHDWVLEGYGPRGREVSSTWFEDVAGWAIWFYQGTAFPMVPCIWPSESGRYPWEAGSAFSASQPLLY